MNDQKTLDAAKRYKAHLAACSGEKTREAFSCSPYFRGRDQSWYWDEWQLHADAALLATMFVSGERYLLPMTCEENSLGELVEVHCGDDC